MKRTAAGLLAAGLLASPAGRADGTGYAAQVLEQLQAARVEAGIARLDARSDLQAIAQRLADQKAALPDERRLARAEPVKVALYAEGIRFRRFAVHVDLNKGHPDPAEAFARSWRKYEEGWQKIVSSRFDAIGLATVRADDGWMILVGVLIEKEVLPAAPDLREMERATLAAVNRERSGSGLRPLAVNPTLIEIARAHSADMMRRRYLAHTTPEGLTPVDRVRRQGLDFLAVGENVHRNRGVDDPVAAALRSWLESEGHRKTLLGAKFVETGVGIAADEKGTIYFTQLFFTPAVK